MKLFNNNWGQFALLLKPYSNKNVRYFTEYFTLVEKCIHHHHHHLNSGSVHFVNGAFLVLVAHALHQTYLFFVNDPKDDQADLHQTVVHFNAAYMIVGKRQVSLLQALFVPMMLLYIRVLFFEPRNFALLKVIQAVIRLGLKAKETEKEDIKRQNQSNNSNNNQHKPEVTTLENFFVFSDSHQEAYRICARIHKLYLVLVNALFSLFWPFGM